ncbi:MAG: hypothetical protein WDM87_03125 [Terracidiphilus sp.]
MRLQETGIRALDLLFYLKPCLSLARFKHQHPLVGENRGRSRFQLLRAVNLVEGNRVPPRTMKSIGEPEMREGITRIQLNGAAKFLFAILEIPKSQTSA